MKESKKEILVIKDLATFEKVINRDSRPYDINKMVMPGTLEDKHRNVDPKKGIPILRRQFNLVYILLGGDHDVHLGSDYAWLQPNDLVIVPENYVCGSPHVKNCKGYCIHFKTEFIQPLLKHSLASDFPFFDLEATHIYHLSPEESEIIQNAFRDIIAEYERFSYEKDYLLRNYIHILLLRIREIYRQAIQKPKEVKSRSFQIAVEFKHLVEKHATEIRDLQQYAKWLHVTSKYLYEAVREATGKSPRRLINDYILLEAKVLLGSTGKSVTEIAHALHFSDHAHFSRFIQLHTGCSPSILRHNL